MPVSTAEAAEVQEVTSVPGESKAKACDGAPDRDDLEQLYELYGPRVYYLCLRMTRNPDDAEDLLQETFLRLIQKSGSFRGDCAFYSWLRRVAINVVLLSFQKASWRRETSLEAMTDPDPFFTCHSGGELATVDQALAGAIDRINLERAIEQLSPGFKTVFILHDIEGYGHQDISRLMGCSVGTSKSQLHKARLKLRQLLGDSRPEGLGQNEAEDILETDEKRSSPDTKEKSILHFPGPRSLKYETPLSRTA